MSHSTAKPCSTKGKQYGTPYYGDIYVYMYDKKVAAKPDQCAPADARISSRARPSSLRKPAFPSTDPQGLQDHAMA